MADKAEAGELSAEETAYFEADGETELETPEVVEEEEQPEARDDDPAKPDEESGKVKTVPHQALHAEREEHRKTKAQLEEISRKQAVLEDRWNTLLKFQQPDQKAQDDDPMPDPDTDIFAYAKWQARQLEKVNSKLSEREQQEQAARQQSEQDQSVFADWNRSVTDFSAQTPDFKEAANYLANLRVQQLSALGLSQAQINATIDNEVKGVVLQAKQSGANPAELIYNYAKVSGYTGKNADDAAKKVADIDAAQKAAKTIAGSGGKSGADPLTPDAIASMSQAEFDAWIQKPENERRFERMMGA